MSLTVKGQDPQSVKEAADRARGLFYQREEERLRREFRERKFKGGIPGDVKQGDIRS